MHGVPRENAFVITAASEIMAILALAADLQDPPELIPELIREWQTGADIVLAARRSRDDGRSAPRAHRRVSRRVLRACAPGGADRSRDYPQSRMSAGGNGSPAGLKSRPTYYFTACYFTVVRSIGSSRSTGVGLPSPSSVTR